MQKKLETINANFFYDYFRVKYELDVCSRSQTGFLMSTCSPQNIAITVCLKSLSVLSRIIGFHKA